MIFAIDMRPAQEGMGGIAEYTSMVARTCAALAPEHTFVLFFSGSSVRLPLWVHDLANVKVHIHNVPNKLTNIALYLYQRPTLDSLIKKTIATPIDAWLLPNLNFVALSSSQKAVMTMHDVSFARYPEFYSSKQCWWHEAVKPHTLLLRAQHLLAVSEYTKEDMMKEFGIPESKITVTPLGINPAYGVSLPSNGKELQTQGRSIVASTAHDPRKNIASVIQGYCLLRQHYPQTADVLLHLVGRQGKWKKEFLSMLPLVYRSSIHIHHNLTYDQLAALTRDASVFVYPSFYEGFGLPLLEAMAMGTPVI
ncbi:MAG: glycosyltransferase family 1 protein, partial [Patescibacteria group bacterium]